MERQTAPKVESGEVLLANEPHEAEDGRAVKSSNSMLSMSESQGNMLRLGSNMSVPAAEVGGSSVPRKIEMAGDARLAGRLYAPCFQYANAHTNFNYHVRRFVGICEMALFVMNRKPGLGSA